MLSPHINAASTTAFCVVATSISASIPICVPMHVARNDLPASSPATFTGKPAGMFRFVLEPFVALGFSVQNALLFKECVSTRIRHAATLVLLFAHEKRVEGVLIETSKSTAEGSFGDALKCKKILDLQQNKTRRSVRLKSAIALFL